MDKKKRIYIGLLLTLVLVSSLFAYQALSRDCVEDSFKIIQGGTMIMTKAYTTCNDDMTLSVENNGLDPVIVEITKLKYYDNGAIGFLSPTEEVTVAGNSTDEFTLSNSIHEQYMIKSYDGNDETKLDVRVTIEKK